MKLVVGLGNPGPRYADTRHNIGFRIVECLAGRLGIALDQSRWDGRLGIGALPDAGDDVAIFQPLTYMNRSGAPVAQAVAGLGIEDLGSSLLVAYDDLDLPFGRLRVRASGGAGGHNGMTDLIDWLETRHFARLRFGIGRPEGGGDTIDWVLGHFSPAEVAEIPARLRTSTDAVLVCLREGVPAAMNRFNRDPEAAET